MAFVPFQFTRNEVAADDPASLAVDDDQIEHFSSRKKGDAGRVHLPHHRLIGAEQQLLPGLSARVKRTRDLSAPERSVVQHPAVLPGKRHPLSDALVDDVDAELGEPIHVRFAGSVVASLDRVVEQAVHAVPVVPIVLCRVDAALGGNAVRPPWAVVDEECRNVVAQFAE